MGYRGMSLRKFLKLGSVTAFPTFSGLEVVNREGLFEKALKCSQKILK